MIDCNCSSRSSSSGTSGTEVCIGRRMHVHGQDLVGATSLSQDLGWGCGWGCYARGGALLQLPIGNSGNTHKLRAPSFLSNPRHLCGDDGDGRPIGAGSAPGPDDDNRQAINHQSCHRTFYASRAHQQIYVQPIKIGIEH